VPVAEGADYEEPVTAGRDPGEAGAVGSPGNGSLPRNPRRTGTTIRGARGPKREPHLKGKLEIGELWRVRSRAESHRQRFIGERAGKKRESLQRREG